MSSTTTPTTTTTSGGETAVEHEMKMRCSAADITNSGYITIDVLKDIMQRMGEDVADADVDEMVDEAGCRHGKDSVDYAKFITAFHAALDDGEGGDSWRWERWGGEEEEDEEEEEAVVADEEWYESGGVSKQPLDGGVEWMESFVVWRVVVDLLLDML